MSPLLVILTVLVIFLGKARTIDVIKYNENLKSDCKVTNVFLTYVSEIIAVSWGPVSNDCSLKPTYKVQYFVDENLTDVSDSVSVGMPMAILPVGKLKCEDVSIKILVLENDTLLAVSNEYDLERDLNNITGLSAERTSKGIEITWNPLNLGRFCKVTYSLRYKVGSNKEEVINDLDSSRFVLPLTQDNPCIPYIIKVEAFSNEMKSPEAEMNYEIGIPSVRDVTLENREGKVVVDFKPPTNIPNECGEVDYQVIQKDGDCYVSDFVILPVSSTGYEGFATNKTIVRQPGAVQSLEVAPKDKNVYLSWKAPIGGIGCDLQYFIKFNQKTVRVHTTHFFAPIQLETCKFEVVQVIPAVADGKNYIDGLSSELELVGDVGPVDDVNCTIKSKFVDCWWNKPQNTELCKKIDYAITYFDGVDTKTQKIEEPYFSFRTLLNTCNFWFNIQPIAYAANRVWEGEVMETIIDGCDDDLYNKFDI
ncbi:uncharacterized protein [Onthophagus taurus]|uniref:uncharacterized protein n=1 Tax=Onthophagus taurus TaxID=166361 RepID=UPI0039BDC36D